MSLEALRKMEQRDLPVSVYRRKGNLFAADSPGKRLALQMVGRRTELSDLGQWGGITPRTQVVTIGSSIDAKQMKNKFEAYLKQISTHSIAPGMDQDAPNLCFSDHIKQCCGRRVEVPDQDCNQERTNSGSKKSSSLYPTF